MPIRIFIILLLAAIISSCGTIAKPDPTTTPPPAVDEALIAQGRAVYRENYCGVCHTLDLANTRGTFGPNHNNTGNTASEYILLHTYNGTATNATDYIRESILEPTIFFTPGFEATQHPMPPFQHLPAEDIDALVYMLAQQTSDHN